MIPTGARDIELTDVGKVIESWEWRGDNHHYPEYKVDMVIVAPSGNILALTHYNDSTANEKIAAHDRQGMSIKKFMKREAALDKLRKG